MAEIRNRELSQFSSFLHIEDATQSIGIATDVTPFVGIGTTSPTSKLTVNGDVLVSSALTATSSNFNNLTVNSSGNIANISGSNLYYAGIGTINTLNSVSGIITNFTSGIGSITRLNAYTGIVTNLSGTGVTYTSGNLTTLNATTGNIVTGIITNLTGTINANIATLNATTGNIVTGVVTTLTSTNASITNLTMASMNYTGSDMNIPTLNVTTGNIVTGVVTTLTGSSISYSGISTFSGVKISSGIVTATNSGIVTYYGDGSKLLNVTASVYLQSDSSTPLLNPTGILSTFNFVNTNGGTTYSGGIASIDVARAASGPSNAVQFKNASGIFSGSSNFTWNGSIVSIAGTCEATNFNTTSDLNFKENIKTVQDALAIVSDLRGVRFDWKTTHQPTIGVIAQEVETILPELVTTADHKTVNYNGIIGVLIEAIKELKTEVQTLKDQINNQQGGL
jgi:hypothetical protein